MKKEKEMVEEIKKIVEEIKLEEKVNKSKEEIKQEKKMEILNRLNHLFSISDRKADLDSIVLIKHHVLAFGRLGGGWDNMMKDLEGRLLEKKK